MVSILKKKYINHIKYVQKKCTRLIFNCCSIYYTSYHDRLKKLNIKSVEYRILEFDLITFFKLVKGETTTNIRPIFESYKSNYFLKENSKKSTCKHHFNNDAWHNSFFMGQFKHVTNFQMN